MDGFTPRRQGRQEGAVAYAEPSAEEDAIAKEIVDASLIVHKELGPGLLEGVYEVCLTDVLIERGFRVERQKPIAVKFKDKLLDAGFRADLVVNEKVLVEIKSVERLGSLQEAQILTYLKFSDMKLGLLINFNVPLIKQGIKRFCMSDKN